MTSCLFLNYNHEILKCYLRCHNWNWNSPKWLFSPLARVKSVQGYGVRCVLSQIHLTLLLDYQIVWIYFLNSTWSFENLWSLILAVLVLWNLCWKYVCNILSSVCFRQSVYKKFSYSLKIQRKWIRRLPISASDEEKSFRMRDRIQPVDGSVSLWLLYRSLSHSLSPGPESNNFPVLRWRNETSTNGVQELKMC